jgi:hypothetical protein
MGRAPPGPPELCITQVVKWLGRLVSLTLILGGLWYLDANPRFSPWVIIGPLVVTKHPFESRTGG